MERFLEHCTSLGLEQTTLNGQKLQNGIKAGVGECSLFFICGYDFVFHPTDRKFWGIEHLFVQENAPFALNLGPSFRPAFRAALAGDGLVVHPPRLGGNRPDVMPKGVRMGGAGNYNLQTRALDLLVTDPNGMDYNLGLTSVIPNLKAAFAKPTPTMGQIAQGEFDEMRSALTYYWGSDLWRLGFAH